MDRPMVIEIDHTEEKVRTRLSFLDDMMSGSLVAPKKIEIMR